MWGAFVDNDGKDGCDNGWGDSSVNCDAISVGARTGLAKLSAKYN
jgi:hypothetical protein